jgi:hypothetical protein
MSEKVLKLPTLKARFDSDGRPAVTIAVPLDHWIWRAVVRRAREWGMDETDTLIELIRRGLK